MNIICGAKSRTQARRYQDNAADDRKENTRQIKIRIGICLRNSVQTKDT